ncbi:Putative porphobilinogen deaminase [Candidatus Phycorickettsia trachydisci]|uniref:5-formyltetrahydrofolate cyclo-ligase n=1 Tax=Candidatus Phycorickettsia trachydisci TaxID=2115978 RepID=A0A2P1P9C4_9RICK|nr:5-formyltetrahydrofolate cyclo-ligase [Candidatus Phycorickettsia trachydisci]AVP87866.1 Putative porphobilinogen deaminase [Candidatus Phycorickettsia trachydisci]
MIEKKLLREQMKQYDNFIPDPNIIQTIKNVLEKLNFQVLGGYVAIRGEVNINEIFTIFQEKSFALPKQINNESMEFAEYNLFDNLEIANSVFLQPINNNFVVPDVLLIPGIAFDQQKNRLGRGAGFYDRYLNINPQIIKIGICKHERLLDLVPYSSQDVKMDYIVTDKTLIC